MTATAAGGTSFPSTLLRRHPLTFPSHFQPAEDLEYSWILEFVLRQPIPDSLAHQIFLSLPFSSPDLHPRLRKTLLLRRLSSDLSRRSISDRTLHSLELIEELDRLQGAGPSARMKAAYCAAAVECTAAAHRKGAADFEANVEGFWMERFFHLIRSEASAGLVSEPLLEWGKRMVHYRSSGKGGEEVLKSDVEDAVRLVKEYVEEALEDMGPTFLEIAAAEFVPKNATDLDGCFGKLDDKHKEMESDGVGERAGGLAGDVQAPSDGLADNSGEHLEDAGERSGGLAGDVRASSEGLADNSGEHLEDDRPREGLAGDVRAPSEGLADDSREHLEEDRVVEESVGLDDGRMKLGNDGDNAVDPSWDSMEMEVEHNDKCSSVSGHDKLDHSEGLVHKVDPSEVTKVKEALQKSCVDLNMMVEDPLPEAHVFAAAVLASMSRASTSVDHSRNSLEDVRCNVSSNLSDSKHLEENHVGKECNKDQGPSQSTGIAPCGSLFNRKPTARTYEWSDDSDDSCFEKSRVPVDNHQSPNPMTRRVFLPKLSRGKFVRKRAVKRWTSEEEDALRKAVAKHGKGNWKLFLNSYKIFQERTEVDLKDKWRNMSRH